MACSGVTVATSHSRDLGCEQCTAIHAKCVKMVLKNPSARHENSVKK